MKRLCPYLIRNVQTGFAIAFVFLYSGKTLGFESAPEEQLFSLSITELMNTRISSVSKREESLSAAAASVFVITNDAIRNSGVTSIPEALRLAPSLQVSRITGTQYAITARGFNNSVSNKLLVLIDGRTVYTPLFSGVFWDHQDMMLEDIERIEVINGPGGTLWGSNAVNGVINIITRDSSATTGALISAHGGTDQGFSMRYGDSIGDSGHFRVYTKVTGKGATERADGGDQFDGSENFQAGFRSDWHNADNHFTLQGDAYQGEEDERGITLGQDLGAIAISGSNVLARWQKHFADNSDARLQIYWDRIKRRDAFLFQPRGEILDAEFQHTVPMGRHKILWGGGYRHGEDQVGPGLFTMFIPDSRVLEWKNLFLQDEMIISESLKGTLGMKVEHNDYTGAEYLPNLRLAWKYSETANIWASVSRAVRAPSRFDKEIYAFFPTPPNFFVAGGPNFESEVANVFEVGYRGQFSDKLAYSTTVYYHDWDKLRSGSALPTKFENKIEGEVYGLEFWATYAFNPDWKINVGGYRLYKDLRLKPDSTDPVGVNNDTLANDADYRFVMRSDMALSDRVNLQISVRHNAELPHPRVPAYTSIDGNLTWRLRDDVEISLAAQNLADQEHSELLAAGAATEFGRMAWLKLVWRR